MKRQIELDVTYPHSPEKVWKAITDRNALAKWLLPNDFEPRLGHRFRFHGKIPNGKSRTIRCEVIELEAPHRLAYTWRTENDGPPDIVTWTLEPVEAGTRLRLEHVGAGDLNGIQLKFQAAPVWRPVLNGRLAQLLEQAAETKVIVGQVSYPSDSPAICIARGRVRQGRSLQSPLKGTLRG